MCVASHMMSPIYRIRIIMFAQLARTIICLQNCHKLCLLVYCSTEYSIEYFLSLPVDSSVDFSKSTVRSRELNYPAEFLRQLGTSAVLYNLQYMLELVPFLVAADVPNSSYITAVTQFILCCCC